MDEYSEDTHYFVTMTAGLERIVWQDLARVFTPYLVEIGHRMVRFACKGEAHTLLALRSVDDAFVECGTLKGIDHTRAALGRLGAEASDLALETALETVRQVRAVPDVPSFAITASFVGARNYSRYDIAEALGAGVRERFGWQEVANTLERHDVHDVHLRVLLEGERALIGLRLADAPLHRRPYKLASRPGSLKAPVAYVMARLAEIAPGQRALDPLCGVGTIALEAATLAWPTPVLGSDLSRAAVLDARQNAEGVAHAPLLFAADASTLPLPDTSIDAVVSNLPFGRQVEMQSNIRAGYAAVVAEMARVLCSGGRAVLLTDQSDALMAAVRAQATLRLTAAHQISLFGLHPIIYVLMKK